MVRVSLSAMGTSLVKFISNQLVEFKYISRVCNSVADALAKKANFVVGLQVWLEDLPDDIAPLMVRDVH